MKLYLKQQVFSWVDRFCVKDEEGIDKFTVEGQLFSLGKQLHIYDVNENPIAHIRQQLLRFMPRFIIEINGQDVCEVVRKVSFLSQNYDIEGLPWQLEGDFWGHEYILLNNDQVLMELSKQWFTWGDSYELNISNDQHELLCLCIALAVDCAMSLGKKG